MPEKSFLLQHEPEWILHRPGEHHALPESAQSWIFESGSITQRLRRFYGDAVQVQILFHHWQIPFFTEQRLLKLHSHRYALIREVMLHADGKPLILARTIIPENTVKAARRNLSHLGTRPLGEVIFSYPKLERLRLNFTLADTSNWTCYATQKAAITQPIWGRRTIYAIRHKPMLVNEFFMPEVLEI